MKKFLVAAASTVCGVGLLPLIPGTFGSLAGLGVYFLLKDSPLALAAAVLGVLAAGFLTAGRAEEMFGRKDPGCVVIDEVAGMLITLSFLPYSPRIVFLGFVLFRLLDTAKPYPAFRLQRMHGSFGIMIDDVVAGVYANLVLQVVVRLTSLSGV
jgi:phosphatidylglycerophosphatase A